MAYRKSYIFIENQKGYPALIYDGHKYNFNHKNKNGTNNWKCVNRTTGCFASATLNECKDIVLKMSEHVCKRQYEQNLRDVAVHSRKKDVCEKMTPVKKIYEKKVTEMHETDSGFSMCSYDEIKSSLYRARHKYLDQNTTEFTRLEHVKIPNLLKHDFLVVEDGETEKILFFSTNNAKAFITNSAEKKPQYFGDGTFKRVPKPFYQLYTVHVDVGTNSTTTTNVVPILFALLPNKTENTYCRFFMLLRNTMGLIIEKFKFDYELAQLNACESIFPNCEIKGCFYHFNRAVWRKAKYLKIDTSMEGRKTVQMCAVIPLLPESEIHNFGLHYSVRHPPPEK